MPTFNAFQHGNDTHTGQHKCLIGDHSECAVLGTTPIPEAAMSIHWPLTAKHNGCAECNKEYESPPAQSAALAAAQDLKRNRYLIHWWDSDEEFADILNRVAEIISNRFPDQLAEACHKCEGYKRLLQQAEELNEKLLDAGEAMRRACIQTALGFLKLGESDNNELVRRIAAALERVTLEEQS
jgi:hypothetical protein